MDAPMLRSLVASGTPPWSMWRYWPTLPPLPGWQRVSLGEGMTPLVPAGDGVWTKLEFVSPTLSFKDRGAAVLVAGAAAAGATHVVADSSGNAGTAIAAYCARAGIAAEVFVPAATSTKKLAAMRAHGAVVRQVPGGRAEAAAAAIDRVQSSGHFYASHVYQPLFTQGTKTFAFEVWEALGERCPAAVVVPAGNGTLVLGAALGFADLMAMGLAPRLPAILAVQAEACAPLAAAWAADLGAASALGASSGDAGSSGGAGSRGDAGCRGDAGSQEGAGRAEGSGRAPSTPTVAEGIAIESPPRGPEVLAALSRSGGGVLTVSDQEILAAQSDLARRGIYVEPTAAAAWAGWRTVSAGGQRAGNSVGGEVVVALCGAGAKGS